MLRFIILVAFVSNFCFSQIQTAIIESAPLNVETLVSVDNFGHLYFIDRENAFHKLGANKDVNYSNVQLGEISSADAFNTLKIILFYRDFNSIILLDNRLSEIYRIDLNDIKPFRNVSHVSTGYDSTLWIFNTDLQQLELFDYKTRKIRVSTLPVKSSVLGLASDFNYAWLLTERFLYTFNYLGSLINKIPNNGYTTVRQENENAILSDGKNLTYFNGKTALLQPISLPNLLIKQFLLTDETLYIYDGEILHKFHIKI